MKIDFELEKKNRLEKKQKEREELVNKIIKLYEEGKARKEIAELLGIKISTVDYRVKKYYEETGKEKPKKEVKPPKTQEEKEKEKQERTLEKIKEREQREKQREKQTEEIVKLYKEGKTQPEIAEIIGLTTPKVFIRIKEYYEKIGEERPKRKRKPRIVSENQELRDNSNNSNENDKKINIKSSKKSNENDKKINEETNENSNEDDKSIDEELKEILMNGNTINKWAKIKKNENKQEIMLKRLEKLRFVVEHSIITDGEFKADEKFIKILDILKNPTIISAQGKYHTYIKPFFKQSTICDQGNLEIIIHRIFKDNDDLAVFVLLGYKVIYKDYDQKIWDRINKNYEEKIDKYFDILHQLEDSQKARTIAEKKEIEDDKGKDSER